MSHDLDNFQYGLRDDFPEKLQKAPETVHFLDFVCDSHKYDHNPSLLRVFPRKYDLQRRANCKNKAFANTLLCDWVVVLHEFLLGLSGGRQRKKGRA